MKESLIHLGQDYWGREVYKGMRSANIYKLVDNKLHTCTTGGEPIAPLIKHSLYQWTIHKTNQS